MASFNNNVSTANKIRRTLLFKSRYSIEVHQQFDFVLVSLYVLPIVFMYRLPRQNVSILFIVNFETRGWSEGLSVCSTIWKSVGVSKWVSSSHYGRNKNRNFSSRTSGFSSQTTTANRKKPKKIHLFPMRYFKLWKHNVFRFSKQHFFRLNVSRKRCPKSFDWLISCRLWCQRSIRQFAIALVCSMADLSFPVVDRKKTPTWQGNDSVISSWETVVQKRRRVLLATIGRLHCWVIWEQWVAHTMSPHGVWSTPSQTVVEPGSEIERKSFGNNIHGRSNGMLECLGTQTQLTWNLAPGEIEKEFPLICRRFFRKWRQNLHLQWLRL